MNITLKLTGDGPLLMHNERLANPFDPITRSMKEITSKRKKTDEDTLAVMRLEFEGGLYFDEPSGPFLPTYNVKRCFVEAARVNKKGKDVERAFVPLVSTASLDYKGPRNIDQMWQKRMYDVRSVKIGMKKVPRCRPMFTDWSIEFGAFLQTDIMNPEDLAMVASTAGSMVGLGDFRQRFGRFTVEVH